MKQLLRQFLQLEASSGIILFVMALIAMIWVNSPLEFIYHKWVNLSTLWINDGLMAVFFLIVGLELKRGFLEGRLSSFSQITLPAVAALGGMLVPALVYILINHASPQTLKGWAIPVATDIAFALAVLSFFQQKIPATLKLFLLALAIFDDMGAMIIIAFFYTNHLSSLWLGSAFTLVLVLCLFNGLGVQSLLPYMLAGLLLWFCLLHSGVHPTLAGVVLALTIPHSHTTGKMETMLHPWVAYLIMPLFALTNAGFSLTGLSMTALTNVVVLGIVMGLFIGKQLGVLGFSWLCIRSGLAKLPAGTTWLQLYGVTLLCGIGFTMSLFLGTLSFENESHYLADVRLGVMTGSILSGLVGAIIFFITISEK